MGFCQKCGLLYPEGHTYCPLDGIKLQDTEDPFLGRVLAGKYRLVSKIGEGGMGVVYRGQHVHKERLVAVKILPLDMSANSEYKNRFLREARAATMVKHKHIVEIFELGETKDRTLFMAMEFLEGKVLQQAIAEGIDLPRIVHVLRQICGVLGPIHAMGIIHRDLKPENIFLVDRDGDPDYVKILDFGIAHLANDPRLTKQGIALGTPEYMAPEIVMGRQPGPEADLYSLGCMAYEMLAGHPPFYKGNPVTIMTAQATKPVPHIGKLSPKTPPDFQQIVMTMLEREPANRHADAYALLRALDEFMPPQRETPRPSVEKSEVGGKKRLELPDGNVFDSGLLGSWKNFAEKSKDGAGTTARKALYEMDELTGKLETLGGMIDRIQSVIEDIEEERRETGRRIRHAIDELARDASQKRHRLMKASARGNDARTEIALLDGKIAAVLDGLVASADRVRASGVDEALVEECLEMGQLAAERRGQQARLGEIDGEKRRFESEIQDIGFQIEALSTRLHTVGEEADGKISDQHEKLESLETQRADLEKRLIALSSEVEPSQGRPAR